MSAGVKLTAGLIISPHRNNYPGGDPEKSSQRNSRKFLTVPKMSHSAHSISLYTAEPTQLVSKTKELSAADHSRARTTLILRQLITIEHEKNPSISSANQNRVLRQPSRQPIRIE